MSPKPSKPTVPPPSFAVFPTVVPQGDGSVLVKPGRPVEWLTVKQFGHLVGLGEDSIYRKIGSDALPERFVDYAGPRKIRIRADALPHFREHYRARRSYGG